MGKVNNDLVTVQNIITETALQQWKNEIKRKRGKT